MPESKHFFEGYSRSKDMLETLADKITSATIERPWTVKSIGYIPGTSTTSWKNLKHLCLSREMKNGDKINVLFIDHWNNATNNVYGGVNAYYFNHDGCDVGNDRFHYQATYYISMQWHSNQVADTDGTPQFGWYWMWVDDEGVALSLFGNVGAAGTATADYRFVYMGDAVASHENFQDTFCYMGGVAEGRNGGGDILDGSMRDYLYPATAPHSWSGKPNRVLCPRFIGNNQALSNPSALLPNNTFVATRPVLAQSSDATNWGEGEIYELIPTHWAGNGQLLFCMPGNIIYRGDIIAIESEGCDYIFQSIGASPLHNILIKRMESVTQLMASGNIGNVLLSWQNPKKCYGVKIVKKAGSQPISHTDGIAILNQTTDSGLILGQAQNVTDLNAEAGQFFYRAFAYSSNGIYSVPVQSATCEITL